MQSQKKERDSAEKHSQSNAAYPIVESTNTLQRRSLIGSLIIWRTNPPVFCLVGGGEKVPVGAILRAKGEERESLGNVFNDEPQVGWVFFTAQKCHVAVG